MNETSITEASTKVSENSKQVIEENKESNGFIKIDKNE